MGGGEFCGIECWKVGNKFYVFGTVFFGMVAVKLFLLFNHSQLLSQSIFGMEWGRQKPLKWQKCFVAAVPYFENLLCFLIAARNKPSIKNTSGFRGLILGLAVRLTTHRLGVITFYSAFRRLILMG